MEVSLLVTLVFPPLMALGPCSTPQPNNTLLAPVDLLLDTVILKNCQSDGHADMLVDAVIVDPNLMTLRRQPNLMTVQ